MDKIINHKSYANMLVLLIKQPLYNVLVTTSLLDTVFSYFWLLCITSITKELISLCCREKSYIQVNYKASSSSTAT